MNKKRRLYLNEIVILIFILILSLLNIKKGYLLKKEYLPFFNKQLIWIIVSVILYMLISKIKFKHIYRFRYPLYMFNIILLIYVLLFSKSINNTKAWLNIFGFSFQPSELIKITYPLLAINIIKNKKYLLSTMLFLIPFILILIEPDTGNSILLFIIFLYLIINKKNKKIFKFITLILVIISSSFIITFTYNPKYLMKVFDGKLYYRFNRIINYKNNYQINNALIGIGNAKALPIPINKLIIYIPEGLTDFMFSFHICNYGIILTIFLIILYILFITSIIKRYNNISNYFSKKLMGSFLTIFIIQTIYNMFMNIGLVPIMGIPLPFFSYGGSNIITYTIFYSFINKKISSNEDMGNNNYKNNYHKDQMDKYNLDKGLSHKQV